MSDRAVDSHEGASVCPFVAFEDDRDRRATDPDHRHRCYAEPTPAPRAIAHQRRYCLSPEFPSCPTFQDWAVRAAATGVSLPSARTIGNGDAVGPVAPLAPAGNGSSRRSRDWAAPPPWVADPVQRSPGDQLTAFGGDESDGVETFDELELEPDDASDEAGGAKRAGGAERSADDDEGVDPDADDAVRGGASQAPADDVPVGRGTDAGHRASAPSASTGDGDRARSGRGFAYDLIAEDPDFAHEPAPDDDDDGPVDKEAVALDTRLAGAPASGRSAPTRPGTRPRWKGPEGVTHQAGMSSPGAVPPAAYAPAGAYTPPTEYTPPTTNAPPTTYSPPAPAPRVASLEPAPLPRATVAGQPGALPPPEYLQPGRRMASPMGAASPKGPVEGSREWERPRRFEAFPTLRTRVGLPGLPRAGRLPPVALVAIALVLAAGILFMLPGFFAGGPQGSGGPSRTPKPSVSFVPTTPPTPTPITYVVKSGDTMSGIAKTFGVSLESLIKANPQVKNPAILKIGQVLNIPDESATDSPVPSSRAPAAT